MFWITRKSLYFHRNILVVQSSTAKLGSDTGELIEDEETVAQKRVRTAKDFIRKLEAQIGSDDENADEDEEEGKQYSAPYLRPAS